MGRDNAVIKVIWFFGKPEYFCKKGWTAGLQNGPSGKSVGPTIEDRSAKTKRNGSPCAVAKWSVSSLRPATPGYGLPRGILQIRCFALCLNPDKGDQERTSTQDGKTR
jgi:hypothetical protein